MGLSYVYVVLSHVCVVLSYVCVTASYVCVTPSYVCVTQVASLVGADYCFLLTDVDGLYTANPNVRGVLIIKKTGMVLYVDQIPPCTVTLYMLYLYLGEWNPRV